MANFKINQQYLLIDKHNNDIKTPVYITDVCEDYLFLNDLMSGPETWKSSDYVLELVSGKVMNKNIRLTKMKQ